MPLYCKRRQANQNQKWTSAENQRLQMAVEKFGDKWKEVSILVGNRNPDQCRQRWTKVSKPGIRKGRWKAEEKKLLKEIVPNFMHEKSKWKLVSIEMKKKGFNRTCKQCREHWYNQLDPELDQSKFSKEEDDLLLTLQKLYGNQWAEISKKLSKKRSANTVKMRCKQLKRFEYESAQQKVKQAIAPAPDFPTNNTNFHLPVLPMNSCISFFPSTVITQYPCIPSIVAFQYQNPVANQISSDLLFGSNKGYNTSPEIQSKSQPIKKIKTNLDSNNPISIITNLTQECDIMYEKVPGSDITEKTAPSSPITQDFVHRSSEIPKISQIYGTSDPDSDSDIFSDLLSPIYPIFPDENITFLEEDFFDPFREVQLAPFDHISSRESKNFEFMELHQIFTYEQWSNLDPKNENCRQI